MSVTYEVCTPAGRHCYTTEDRADAERRRESARREGREVVVVALPYAVRRFSPHGRAANILLYLREFGPARSFYTFINAVGPKSTRYHYEACDRLTAAGLIAHDYSDGGQTRDVRITPLGLALLAYWEGGGR